MRVKFWGVRGSIPSPGPRTVKYGGNTTCIEVEVGDNQTIILDSGTGIFPLSQSLLKKLPLSCSIFISHTHWDHIQGLPFFVPFFIPGNKIKIFGPSDPILQRPVNDILSRQLEYCYFPVREAELKADIQFETLYEGQTVEIGTARISTILMNHPAMNLGYKIISGGKSIFFTGDHEPLFNIYPPQDECYEEYEGLIAEKNRTTVDFFRGVDILIADSTYITEEYPAKRGWGHGTFDTCIALAREAGVQNLYFTHHEPLRSDDDLERIAQKVRESVRDTAPGLECCVAHEGLEIKI
jgi:phosphoribosyl 1,2-cyclic phosphodiesterase